MDLDLSDAQRQKLERFKARQKGTSSNASQQPKPPTNNPISQTTKPQTQSVARPINNKYNDIDDLELTVSRQVDMWKDSDFKNLKIYNIQQLQDDELNLFGRAMVNAINTENVTSDIVFMMLYMAVSLRSTADVGAYLLYDVNAVMTSTIPHPKPDVTVGNDHTGIDEDEVLDRLKTKIIKKKNAEQRVDDAMASTSAVQHTEDMTINKTSSAACYAYMAAFLLRLNSRDPESLVGKLETAKARFAGFYDDGKEVFDEVQPNMEAFKMIRDILARKPEIISTWVAWVAYSENEHNLVKQDRGLLEYLALQVFAYQGMHVVVQILAIHQISKFPMGNLLRELDCRMTRSAVKEVHIIIRDYHRNANYPNRKTYFRYARVWDEGYFSRVQSKNCAQLLYLAAKTVKELSPNSNSDPTQIYAVKSMSETMKEQLNIVSNKLLVLILSSVEDDDETGQIWKK
uniref:Nucleoprotein n=1 Tax=Allium chinense virus 1 TaxID=2793720 RepID=A0A8D9PGY0_9RHAB|nr:TPA_asm: N [Allium chinense virus 1]